MVKFVRHDVRESDRNVAQSDAGQDRVLVELRGVVAATAEHSESVDERLTQIVSWVFISSIGFQCLRC
jgi:hypothetical protein